MAVVLVTLVDIPEVVPVGVVRQGLDATVGPLAELARNTVDFVVGFCAIFHEVRWESKEEMRTYELGYMPGSRPTMTTHHFWWSPTPGGWAAANSAGVRATP